METTPKMGHAVDIAWGLIYKCMKNWVFLFKLKVLSHEYICNS